MKRLFAFLLLLSGFAFGQASVTGTISASASDCNTTNACLSFNLPINTSAVSVTITGTFTGTLQFENAGDGTTFVSVLASPQPSGTVVSSTTSTGVWVVSVAGMTDFRVRASALASGSATITIKSSLATPVSDTAVAITSALPAGTNIIGKVGIDQTTPGTTNAVQATNFPATIDTNSGATGANTPRTVANQGAPNSLANFWPVRNTDGTNSMPTMDAASRAGFQQGTLTNNNAAPSTNQFDVMPGLANAVAPTYTEGNSGKQSFNLHGAARIVGDTGSFADRSGSISVGATSQTLAAANTSRKRIIIQNPCNLTDQGIAAAENLYINFTSAATVSGGNSITLAPCGSYDSGTGPVTTELITVIATTVNHKYIAKEM